jgi:hypothetical protein
MNNPCIRCGKERIVVKIKKKYINNSLITTTTTTCPDPECQKKLDADLAKKRALQEQKILNRKYY